MMAECFFKERYGKDCKEQEKLCQSKGPSRIQSIINASKTYGDDLHLRLEGEFATEDISLSYHKNCVSRYTSKTNLSHHQNVTADTQCQEQPTKKRFRRSEEQFDFKHHCLYCAETCDVDKDPKNPARWRPSYLVRSTHSEYEQQPYTDYILSKCSQRSDAWSEQVKLRIHGAFGDLHAVEGRYHVDCRNRFFSDRACSGQTDPKEEEHPSTDAALEAVVRDMYSDKSRLWNSTGLYDLYQSHSGTRLSKRNLLTEVQKQFGNDLLVLTSPGIASIVAFRSASAHILKIVSDDEKESLQNATKALSTQIISECKEIKTDPATYSTSINKEQAANSTSSTLQDLLAAISPDLSFTLPALLIGNMITSIVTKKTTGLQLALGMLFRDSKELLSHMFDYKVTCSYDEVLRFKKSAAVAASTSITHQGISDAKSGLVQVVADNFDCDISSPNGKASTHSLAMIVMQPSTNADQEDVSQIRRLRKTDLHDAFENQQEPELRVYAGRKDPPMPCVPMATQSDQVQRSQNVSKARADHYDFQFLQTMMNSDSCPEFNGYMTRICREEGHALQPMTKIVYLPLIDMPPAHQSTMLTAMLKAKEICHEIGQAYVVFTCDQQLYRVALQVKWDNPDLLDNVHLRLGGMHLLMSYCGCIGTLMADTGLEDIMGAAFSGVGKMLSGKKFPQNIRALRLVAEELLRPIFMAHPNNLTNMDELREILSAIASQNRTSKLWIECLIIPVFHMMTYIRAERESDWNLHLAVVEDMLPLFFAAGHVNYARYASYYLQSMYDLPNELQQQMAKGEHTMHHIPGLFNGIWSDMAIETTFMRYGHSKHGMVGITLNPDAVKTWAYSLHACHSLLNSLNAMRNDQQSSCQTSHKEESPGRMKLDQADRKTIRDKLELCVDPLDPVKLSDGLVNVVTGQVTNHPSVNPDQALQLGQKQLEKFQQTWPESFYQPIPKVVHSMATTRKHIKVGENKIINTEAIYARAMSLHNTSRDLAHTNLMSYELSPVPTALFDDHGDMRVTSSKATLKNALKIEVAQRTQPRAIDAIVLDGCAILWVIQWPASGSVVQDYLDNVRKYLHKRLKQADVFLIFDRYVPSSTKDVTRSSRENKSSRVYSLTNNTRLPVQSVVLAVAKNKAQLIDLIVDDLKLHADEFQSKRLVITGKDAVPVELNHGQLSQRPDMLTTHEEADTIIIQQVSQIRDGTVLVVADDTDVFLLLLFFCNTGDISSTVLMASPVEGRSFLDIKASAQKYSQIIPDLLAAHALTGCDTVASPHSIGKMTALKVLKSQTCRLDQLGLIQQGQPLSAAAERQSVAFVLACYSQGSCRSLSEARQRTWTKKIAQRRASAPQLSSLPPTDEALRQNILRAQLQVAIWRHALDPHPPDLDVTLHGWSKRDGTDTLHPVTVPEGVPLIPDELLQLIKCSCQADRPCRTQRCSCKNASLPCSTFCTCKGEVPCENIPQTALETNEMD